MIFDLIFTALAYVLTFVFDILSAIFVPLVLPPDFAAGVGTVFGNIWLLNSFLPVDHLFSALALALSWKLALFAYDGLVYILTFVNLIKRTFFSVGG